MSDSSTSQLGQTLDAQPQAPQKNGPGLAGFILSLCALFLGWIPIIGWIIWVLGLIFSSIGMFRQPKGFAIAGLVISLVGVVLMLFLFAALGIAAAGAAASAGSRRITY